MPRFQKTSLLAAALLTALLAAPLLAAPLLAESLPHRVEAAHGGEIWDGKTALETYIQVDFGGKTLIKGKMLMDTPVGKTRFELVDGTVLVFDGQDAWTSPADSAFEGTRFHVLTWPYFLAAPMKLDDPGTHLEDLGPMAFRGGRDLPAARLTFDGGVGDSPEDWYVVYTHPQSHQLEAMAYIVTFGKSAEEAEKEPHAIVYSGYQDIDGVRLATQWNFYNWSEDDGILGDEIGEVTLTDPRFVEPAAGAFTPPEGAIKAPSPAK